jgi:hypothetical protein
MLDAQDDAQERIAAAGAAVLRILEQPCAAPRAPSCKSEASSFSLFASRRFAKAPAVRLRMAA